MLRTAIAAALLVPAAATAGASAATLAVNRPCYVNKFTRTSIRLAPMQITGSGYVPGDGVTITSSDESINRIVQADSAGLIEASIGAPTPFFKPPASLRLTLTASDFSKSNGTITATTSVSVTDLAVATVPSIAPPARRVTWYFSGFDKGRYVYGHYLRHGREVARARFGRTKGDCGLLRTRAPFFPGGRQRYASYGLQFDDARHYSRHTSPRIVTSLGPK
ncbi:MAG TPA: hypothetical protein VGG87_11935 [Solirubrobacteraceae bacterium]